MDNLVNYRQLFLQQCGKQQDKVVIKTKGGEEIEGRIYLFNDDVIIVKTDFIDPADYHMVVQGEVSNIKVRDVKLGRLACDAFDKKQT